MSYNYFVPCIGLHSGDSSNGVEYFEASENNMFMPPEVFVKNGINGYKHEYKDTNVFPNIIHVVGAYDELSSLLNNVVESENIWL